MSTQDPGSLAPGSGQPQQIFCPNCHGGNPPNATTCMWCGRPLGMAAAPRTASGQPQQPPQWIASAPPPGAYPGGPGPAPYSPQQSVLPPTNVNAPRKGLPVWAIILLVLVALCLVGSIGTFLVLRQAAEQGSTALGSIASRIEVESTRVAGELAATPAVMEEATAIAAEATAASEEATAAAEAPTPAADEPTPAAGSRSTTAVGSSATSGDLKITVDGVRRTQGEFLKAKEGNEYVIVSLRFENTGKEEAVVSSLLSYSLEDSSGGKYNIAITDAIKDSADGSIPAGGTLKGESAFEVPKDASGLVFVYNPILGGSEVRIKLDK